METEKKCKYCGELLVRRINKKNREALRDFRRRKFCNKKCAAKFQNFGKNCQEINENHKKIKEAGEKAENGTKEERKLGITILEEVANNSKLDWITRINAAKALLPYQSKKADSVVSKKGEQADKAKTAAGGKFSARSAPVQRVK